MDDITFSFLKVFNEHHSLNINEYSLLLKIDRVHSTEVIQDLLQKNYIKDTFSEQESENLSLHSRFCITYNGMRALILYKKERHRHILLEIRNWASLIIALAAFIKSFFF